MDSLYKDFIESKLKIVCYEVQARLIKNYVTYELDVDNFPNCIIKTLTSSITEEPFMQSQYPIEEIENLPIKTIVTNIIEDFKNDLIKKYFY